MVSNKLSPDQQDGAAFVEIVDDNNRPLAVLAKDMVHRQLLQHRSVQILVFDTEKKLYLQKRNDRKRFFPGRWDVSARTHPRVNEASLDAAIRALKKELRLETDTPQYVRTIPACAETGFEFVTLYAVVKNTQPIVPNLDEVTEGYYFSREELTCLIKEFRELLTPNLVTLWEASLLVTP